jgi:hypothetical protein
LLLTVKQNQRRLYQQIISQFRGHRRFPVEISDVEASHGRRVRWVGASWIIKLVSTGWRDGKPFRHVHYFISTLRTSPKALLRLVRSNGFRSIRAGLMAVAHDISRMLSWAGISLEVRG